MQKERHYLTDKIALFWEVRYSLYFPNRLHDLKEKNILLLLMNILYFCQNKLSCQLSWMITWCGVRQSRINPLLFKLSTASLIICSTGMNCKPKSISFLAPSIALDSLGRVSLGNLHIQKHHNFGNLCTWPQVSWQENLKLMGHDSTKRT